MRGTSTVDAHVGPVHLLGHIIRIRGHDEGFVRGTPHGNVDTANHVVFPDGRRAKEEGCDLGEAERKGGRVAFDIHRRGI